MKLTVLAATILAVTAYSKTDCYGKKSGADDSHLAAMMNSRDRLCMWGDQHERIEVFDNKWRWTARSNPNSDFSDCYAATQSILDNCWHKKQGGGEWMSRDGKRTYTLGTN